MTTLNSTHGVITKSGFMDSMRCNKMLWLAKHKPELAEPMDEWTRNSLESGIKVGLLAQKLYPDGTAIDNGHRSISEMRTHTEIARRIEMPIIFGATVAVPELGVLCIADMLCHIKNSWALQEVKACTTLVPDYLFDVAFQGFCFRAAGYDIQKFHIIHLNKDYSRNGEIDPSSLFLIDDVTEQVVMLIPQIPNRIKNLHKILGGTEEPQCIVGSQCKYDSPCPFYAHCHKGIPDGSVFELPHHNGKAQNLFANGIYLIRDIPDWFPLSERQAAVRESAIVGAPVVDIQEIKDFLIGLKYPLYFLDFEALPCAIPRFNNSAPYQQLPFQFSLHVQHDANQTQEHFEFLTDSAEDPRKSLIDSLLRHIGDEGSVLVWNRSFETSILKKLAVLYPEHAPKIHSIIDRIVDLIVPFRSCWWADARFRGSFSLKSVLPELCPHLSYDALSDIHIGTQAALEYQQFLDGVTSQEKWMSLRRSMLEYCGLDTLAEFEILKVLYSVCE